MSLKASDSSAHKRLAASGLSHMDNLPDEIVTCILEKVVADANTSADVINVLLTSRRMCELGTQAQVLKKVSPLALAMRARSLCEGSHRFLQKCTISGNTDACYILGMIKFYCLGDHQQGATLLAKAALAAHPHALHSLAIIHFNGSGGTRHDRDLVAGVLLCARAAAVGHVEALRELGHCLQDGYGVQRDIPEGRRMLQEANVREAARALACSVAVPRCAVPSVAPRDAVSQCGMTGASGATVCNHVQASPAALPVASAGVDTPGSNGNVAVRVKEGSGKGEVQVPTARVLTRAAAVSSAFAREHANTTGSWNQERNSVARGVSNAAHQEEVIPHRVSSGSRVDLSALQSLGSSDSMARAEGDAQLLLQSGLQQPQNQQPDRQSQHGHHSGAQHLAAQAPGSITQAPAGTDANGALPFTERPPVAECTAHSGPRRCCCLPHVTLPLSWWHVAVHKFLVDWHTLVPLPEGFRVCCNELCGRSETRKQEFRCCSACGEAKYCSRVCQAVDWKAQHKVVCPLIAARVQQEQEVAARMDLLRQQAQAQQQENQHRAQQHDFPVQADQHQPQQYDYPVQPDQHQQLDQHQPQQQQNNVQGDQQEVH
ncbi:unnamed protein product [Closterium sp. Yama58-4]|nr:unnamed protein product [Closterium sp. Yama58-4]